MPFAKPRTSSQESRLYRRLLLLACAFIIYAATLPFDFVIDRAVIHEHIAAAVQRSALSELANVSRTDVLQNVLLFIPFGALAMAAFGHRRTLVGFSIAVLLAAVVSAVAELLQLLTADRITAAWDLGANVFGAFVGAAAWAVAAWATRRMQRQLALHSLFERRTWPVTCATVLVCIAAWEPFDVTLDVGTVWSKVKPVVQGEWATGRPIVDELLTALRFGILTVAALVQLKVSGRRAGRVAIAALVACVLLAVGLEASQFLITSRSPSLQDLEAMIAGVMAGGMLTPLLMGARRKALVMTAATIAAAIPFYLAPFELAAAHRGFATMPFLNYYEFTSRQTVSHVIELMMIFAPVGFTIVWAGDGHRIGRALIVVVGIAAALEYAQGWIVGRFPDITDVGMAVLGGLAGALLARRGAAQSAGMLP